MAIAEFGRRLAAALLAAAAMAPAHDRAGGTADVIFWNGKVVTLNHRHEVASAVAIAGGRILAVGPDTVVRALAGPATRQVDLKGRTLVPGLVDSHYHATSYGMRLFQPDLSAADSLAAIVELIAARARELPAGAWITNSGFWNETKLRERRSPTRIDLDGAAPNNPVYLNRGHLGVVNTAALRALGITRDTRSPEGGTIERDPATGEPTGRLYERAQEVAQRALPPTTHEQLMAAQQQSFRDLAAAGVTSVRSASETPEAWGALVELARRGQLALRTQVLVRVDPTLPAAEVGRLLDALPPAPPSDPALALWGIKMVADGGSDLALLRRDYANRPGFRGQAGASREAFVRAARAARARGLRVGIHALGDAAVDLVLDVYDALDRDRPLSGERWAIEHGYFLWPEQIARARRLGLVVHPQTWHLYNLRRNFLDNYGRAYADRSHPYRSLLAAGIPIAGGTDWRLEPSDPFFYMWVETSRRTIAGDVVGASQRLTREEALRFHTVWAAYSTFEEGVKGTIEPGRLADLVVLSDDYFGAPEDRVRQIAPVLTMVGGRPVFQARPPLMP